MNGPCRRCGKPTRYKPKNRGTTYDSRCVDCRNHDKQCGRARRKYGMTRKEYEASLARANGKCEACGTETIPQQDHCHATGKPRGILCVSCNLILGHAKDDPQRLRLLIRYLEKHARNQRSLDDSAASDALREDAVLSS